jgi:hypothetical protein
MVGSQSGRFDCTGLPAGPTERLGAVDALFIEPDFNGGVWRLCACYAGAMERLARLTARQIDQTGSRGDPLAAHRLGHLAMEAMGAGVWWWCHRRARNPAVLPRAGAATRSGDGSGTRWLY